MCRRYNKALKRLARSKGRRFRQLKKSVGRLRARMIKPRRVRARNHSRARRQHSLASNERLHRQFLRALSRVKSGRELARKLQTAEGRKQLAQYQKQTGLPWPTEIKRFEIPGPRHKSKVFAGWGRSPGIAVADGPKERHSKKAFLRRKGFLGSDASGRKLYIFTGRNSRAARQILRNLGYAPETHYVPTREEEAAGTFKKGKYWVHKHDDEGGRWPRVRIDQAGNIVYDRGTYTAKGAWLRR